MLAGKWKLGYQVLDLLIKKLDCTEDTGRAQNVYLSHRARHVHDQPTKQVVNTPEYSPVLTLAEVPCDDISVLADPIPQVRGLPVVVSVQPLELDPYPLALVFQGELFLSSSG